MLAMLPCLLVSIATLLSFISVPAVLGPGAATLRSLLLDAVAEVVVIVDTTVSTLSDARRNILPLASSSSRHVRHSDGLSESRPTNDPLTHHRATPALTAPMCPNVLILKASLSSTMALNISHPPIGSHSASVWSIEYPYLEIIVVLLLFIVQILMPSDLCREDIVGVELNLEHGATSRNNGSAIPIFSTPNDQLQWPFEGIADFAYHDPVLLRASRKIITSKPALRAHESSPVALTTCGEAFRDVRQAVHKGDSVLQSAEDLDASIRYISPFNTSRHDLDKWEHSAWRTPKSFPASVVPNLNFGSGLADDVIVCMQTTSSVNMPPPPGQDMSRSMHSMNRPPIQFGLCDNTGVFDSVRSLPDALDSSFRTHADGQGFVTDSADGKIVVISGNDAESSDFARILDTSTPDSIVGGSCSRTKDLSATDTSLTSSVLADDPRPVNDINVASANSSLSLVDTALVPIPHTTEVENCTSTTDLARQLIKTATATCDEEVAMCADASEVGDIVETVRSSAKAVVPVASLCLQPSKAPTALSQDTLDSYSVALVSTPTSCSLADNRPNGAQSVDSLNPAAVGSGSSLGPSTSHIEAREATLNDASETRATAMSQSPQMGVPAEDREREPKDQPEGPAEQATKRSRRIGRAGQKRRKEKNRERAEQYRQRVGKEPIGQGCSDAIGDKSGTVGSAMSITAADETVISVKNVEDGLAIASASASVAVIEAASARKDISKENNNAKADAGPKARKPDSPSEYTSFSAEYEQSMGSGHPFIDPFVEPSDTSSSITANPPNDNSRPVSSGAFFSSLSVTARSASPENRWRAFLRSQHLDEAAINDIPAQVSDSSYVEDDMDEDADSYEQLEWISQASYSSNIKSDHFGQSYRTGQHMQRTANVYPPEHGYDVGLADPWPPRGHHVQTPTARTGISQQYRDDYETTSWIERWMSSEDFPGTAGPSLAGPLHGYRPPYSELEQSRSQDDDAHDEADHLPGPESRADGARWRNRKNNKWRDVRRYKKRPQNALNSASLNPAAQPTLATPQPTADVPYLMEDPGASLGWNWNGNEKEKARQQ